MPTSSFSDFALVALLIAAPAAAKKKPPVDYAPALPVEITAPATPGAIFSAGYAPLTSGSRAASVGDVLTVVLVERMQATKSNSAKTGRDGSIGLTPPTTGPLSFFSAADVNMGGKQSFNGKGEAEQSNALSGEMSVTVIAVRPNGTMLVRGEKALTLNRGDEHVQLSGIVRVSDISPDNRILSTRIADARIGYTGKGEIARASRQGWLQRFFSAISPSDALAPSLLAALAAPVHAERIKDMGAFEGLRVNQLTGYGIVVGLAGTGDDSLDYSTLAMRGAVSRFGLTLPPGVNPSLKNAAAVMITAELPPFAKPGMKLDVTVSAMGKAKSLRGGTLIMAPLLGADGQIYAMAQGNLVVGGLGVEAADGSKVSVNIPSAGRIGGGATVERTVDTGFTRTEQLTFNLSTPDLTNARLVAEAINKKLGGPLARAVDGVSIAIAAPVGGEARTAMMAQIENVTVTPTAPPARVIVNARTGTVVINGMVRILPAAVTHGKLTVRVDEAPRVVQPNAFGRGQTAVEQSSDVSIEENAAQAFLMRGASLADIVAAINRIGTSPGDLVAVLEALKQAGALQGELVII